MSISPSICQFVCSSELVSSRYLENGFSLKGDNCYGSLSLERSITDLAGHNQKVEINTIEIMVLLL